MWVKLGAQARWYLWGGEVAAAAAPSYLRFKISLAAGHVCL